MLTPKFRSQSSSGGSKKTPRAIVFFMDETCALPSGLRSLDRAHDGMIARTLSHSNFEGKAAQTLIVPGIKDVATHVILTGIGNAKQVDALILEDAAGHTISAVQKQKLHAVEMICELAGATKIKPAEVASRLAFGAKLSSYRFDKYKTTQKPKDKPTLKTIDIVVRDTDAAKKLATPLLGVADAVKFARDIVTEPGNVIHPESLAELCKGLSKHGLKVEVLSETQMKKLGMGALLGVGQGSVKQSKLVVLQWAGGKKGDKPVALVGKGVTFDTGGISIKPSNGMEEMKFDMAGSASVIGALYALAARKAKVNAVGVVGLVENMPDGDAQRPGDVVTSMSGQTIAVLNTDAEGRLVLADALWYTQSRFKPKAMVDLATLTGAILVALGSKRAGLFSNDDAVADSLMRAGEEVNEIMWRLPMGDDYDDMINSEIADMQNISDGREAGSTTAAQFLQRFVNDVPWAHLDIAGAAWTKKAQATTPSGATAYGVRLLDRWIANVYEA
jgi:leucyl aminopeptidase